MPTIKEIARRAGVSIGTVDRVLHDRGDVSKVTERKVRKVVATLRYEPNPFARQLSLAKTYRFGVIMPKPDQDSGYWRLPATGIRKAAGELAVNRVRVDFFHFDKFSEPSFQLAWDRALELGLDGLLIAPVLTQFSSKRMKGIPRTIPFVLFDSILPGAGYTAFVGQNARQGGVLAARLMHLLVGEPALLAAVMVHPEDAHIADRAKGFEGYFESHSGFRVVPVRIDPHHGTETFERVIPRMLSRHADLKGIFVTNACTHAVAECLHRHPRGRRVRLIGYDLVPKNVAFLKDGSIDFLISQRPDQQGYLCVYSLYRHVVLRQRVAKNTFVPLDIITRENVDFFHSP